MVAQASNISSKGSGMKLLSIGFLALVAAAPEPAKASEIEGPARFCGYSPIIDLLHGEKVTTLDGGIHGGSFRWEGSFGEMHVYGIGWARRPDGRIIKAAAADNPARFGQRKTNRRYRIAIWNGSHAAAYFESSRPFTVSQLKAIDRVRLYEEEQAPADCSLRTVFVVE
ncbi:hypothetical protein ACGGKE_13475 [Sphingobium naphthae]|jgi:hypothetical protein|uniref:hypothetical protein n=2 Tax=Sphingomonadaceae TaxID=41297 RepID=UPI0019135C45